MSRSSQISLSSNEENNLSQEDGDGVLDTDKQEMSSENVLLPDNLFIIKLVYEENNLFPSTDYVIMLSKNDPLYLLDSPPLFINIYSGNKFISVLDYIQATEDDYMLNTFYNIDPDIITAVRNAKESTNGNGLTEKKVNILKNKATIDYNNNIKDIEAFEQLSELSKGVLFSPLINYRTFSLSFTYAYDIGIDESMKFDNIVLSRDSNIMFIRDDYHIRISESAPELETLIKLVRDDKIESLNVIEMLYFIEKYGYQYATYNTQDLELTFVGVGLNKNLVTVATEDQLNELQNETNQLIEFYASYVPPQHNKITMVNITGDWVMYFEEGEYLDINMLIYAVTVDKIPGFILDETVPYIIKPHLTFFYSLEGRQYLITIQPYLVDTETLVYSTKGGQSILMKGQGIKIVAENIPNEDILIALQFSIGAIIRNYINFHQARDIEEHTKQLKYTTSYIRTNNSGNKLQRLQSADPELFINGYAKKCQEKNQGVVIPDDKLEQWVANNPSSTYLTYPKEPIPGVQTIHYGCPNSQFLHAGLKRNLDLPNNKQHPVIPCCYAKDQRNSSSVYNMYLEDTKQITDVNTILQTQNKKQISAVNKILSTFRIGNISNLLLENFARVKITNNLVRMGVYKSNNTFIHCIFHAMKYEPYENINDIIEREFFVKQWRVDLGEEMRSNAPESINISLLRQELYDYTIDEIINLITNLDKGFNSETLYRILEDMFKINIFVFVSRSSGESIKLEIPRNKITHVREPRLDRKSIMIFKHDKGDSIEPHYELIVEKVGKENINAVFGKSITKQLFLYFHDVYSTQIIESINGDNIIHFNIYNSYSIRETLNSAGFLLSYQYLDDYGKCRGFLVTAPTGESGSILCMPQQPLNLPTTQTIYKFTSEILQYFDSPSKVDRQSGITLGVWYGTDSYNLAYYIPLSNAKNDYDELDRAGNPLVPSSSQGSFAEHVNAENLLEMILRIITELYRLYGKSVLRENNRGGVVPKYRLFGETEIMRAAQEKEIHKQQNLRDFTKYLVAQDVEYKFNKTIPELLEKSSDLKTLFEALLFTGLVAKSKTSYKIVLPTEEMRLNMIYFVETHLVTQHESFYSHYRTETKTSSFESMVEFKIWVASKLHPNMIITSAKQLEADILALDNTGGISISYPKPRIYNDPTGVIVIIQNVIYGDLDRAITVSIDWRDNKLNGGYYSNSKVPNTTPHNIYVVSGNNLVGTNIIEGLPSVLKYSNGTYAAILPLM